MPADIKEGKLLYHMTLQENLCSILDHGLLPRSALKLEQFRNVADPQILESRAEHRLDTFVPFHFFANNPFDGRVQKDFPGQSFVILAVQRTKAQANNWKIIPRHPLSGSPQILDYEDGMAVIDWSCMNQRDYTNDESRLICMAECLSPQLVAAGSINRIFVKTDDQRVYVLQELKNKGLSIPVTVNANMFLK